jgi:hypothetical protein
MLIRHSERTRAALWVSLAVALCVVARQGIWPGA